MRNPRRGQAQQGQAPPALMGPRCNAAWPTCAAAYQASTAECLSRPGPGPAPETGARRANRASALRSASCKGRTRSRASRVCPSAAAPRGASRGLLLPHKKAQPAGKAPARARLGRNFAETGVVVGLAPRSNPAVAKLRRERRNLDGYFPGLGGDFHAGDR